jgi:hypothetical protein
VQRLKNFRNNIPLVGIQNFGRSAALVAPVENSNGVIGFGAKSAVETTPA